MSPGERTMPAAIVFPTAAAIPNHMPRTLSNPPPERVTAEPVRTDAVVVVPSDMLDNGFSGLRYERILMPRELPGPRNEGAMIMAGGQIAKETRSTPISLAVRLRIQTRR
jgi:hypothetical protein